MKLKQSPNDFKVEEIIKFNVLNSGNYRLFKTLNLIISSTLKSLNLMF